MPIDQDSGPPAMNVELTIDPQVSAPVNSSLLVDAACAAARMRGFSHGQIGIRVTDDETIESINGEFLDHHYATDVISFGYERDKPVIEGEMVVSVDTARTRAAELGWSIDHELCLYVVHGTLHVTGMDDHDPADRAAMRAAEAEVMQALGIDEIVRFGVDANETGTREASDAGSTESSA